MPRENFGDEFSFLDRKEILTFEEIQRLVRIFIGLGVEKVRLTGGEPLLRRGLALLVEELGRLPGLRETTLTTDGSLLASQALPLKQAGLSRLTVSQDSLYPARFLAQSDSNVPLARVLEGLEAADRAGFRGTKLNCVLRRGVNDDDILPLAGFAREHGYTLRFIEFMDVGSLNGWRMDSVIPAAEVAAMVGRQWPMERFSKGGPNCVAQHWRYRDGRGELGLIASVTEPFCSGCDRARLSADGALFTCLFAATGLDLKTFLRGGASDPDLAALLEARWKRRDDRYSERRGAATRYEPRAEMYHLGG